LKEKSRGTEGPDKAFGSGIVDFVENGMQLGGPPAWNYSMGKLVIRPHRLIGLLSDLG
jgi:hypothetical protein